jgi:Ca-activated chloride channel homolog
LYLLTLLVVPLLVAFAVAARRRRSPYPVEFTNLGILASVNQSPTPRRTWVPLALLVLALALAGSALAHPNVDITKKNSHSTIVLLVDVSGSMAANDIKPDRITAAVEAMQGFVHRLPAGTQVGLVEFSSEPAVVASPTADHETILSALTLLGPSGATALGDGLGTAVQLVQTTLAGEGYKRKDGEQVPAAIVLLSDGAQNRGSLTPLQAAARAKAAGIRVYTIAYGTPTGTIRFEGLPGAVPVPPDPATMRVIASTTGGQMFDAQTAGEALDVYKRLGSTVASTHEHRDITSWFSLGAGLVLISAVTAGLVFGPTLP